MLVAEYNNLTPVKVLIDNLTLHLELFENKEGNLFVCSSATEPKGLVYYATTPALFSNFLEELITLQKLFDKSPSLFVEIHDKDKVTLYSRQDVQIKLACGDQTIGELIGGSPMEVW